MKITGRRATLAQAEEDVDSEDESDREENDGGGGGGNSEVSAFDVAGVPFIDDELATEQGLRCRFPADIVRPHSASCRYVVVSGTPLKILEHLLSDLRLDDQRGFQESRESGESLGVFVNLVGGQPKMSQDSPDCRRAALSRTWKKVITDLRGEVASLCDITKVSRSECFERRPGAKVEPVGG